MPLRGYSTVTTQRAAGFLQIATTPSLGFFILFLAKDGFKDFPNYGKWKSYEFKGKNKRQHEQCRYTTIDAPILRTT